MHVHRHILQAEGISKFYQIGSRRIQVLDDVALTVADGEFLVIEGASGSGKSTLLSLLSGLDKPSAGRIRLQGRDITDISEDDLAPIRNAATGFVFQAFHLVPALTALENVMFPAELRGDREAAAKAEALVRRVGLADRANHKPRELSGGQEQRVAIARAIVSDPSLLVCDEPTGDLDRETADEILELLQMLNREHGKTIVMVTHDPKAADHARRLVRLDKGALLPDTESA